jgi:hypothetical protein
MFAGRQRAVYIFSVEDLFSLAAKKARIFRVLFIMQPPVHSLTYVLKIQLNIIPMFMNVPPNP